MVDYLGVTLAGMAALGLASQAIFVRVGTTRGRSADVLLVSFLVNVCVLVPLALVTGYPDYGLTPIAVLAFACAGVIGTMAGRALLYAGIKRVGASRAEPLKASMPLHATVVAVLVLGEALTPSHGIGIVLIVAGVVLVSWEGSRTSVPGTDGVPLVGLALPFMAAFFFGVEPVFAKLGFAEGTPFLVGLAIKLAAAATTLAVYLAWRGRLPTRSGIETGDLRWYVATGVASTAFSLAYYAALVRAPVVVVVPIMQASPLFVALLSVVFLQRLERVTWRLVASAAVIVAGAVLVTLAS